MRVFKGYFVCEIAERVIWNACIRGFQKVEVCCHPYKGRRDLIDNYGDNSLLLYALQLRYDIEDIISVAAEALTDGSDDKK